MHATRLQGGALRNQALNACRRLGLGFEFSPTETPVDFPKRAKWDQVLGDENGFPGLQIQSAKCRKATSGSGAKELGKATSGSG